MSSKLLVAATVCAGLSACGSAPRDLGRLGFMVGCWKSEPSKDPAAPVNLEVWSEPQGGLMFGYATTTQAGKMTTWEDSRIDLRQARAVYSASPEGQRPTLFTESQAPATPAGGKDAPPPAVVTFENGEHDYPQRITYRKTDKGLAATISKLDGSQPVSYAWAPCQ